MIRGIPFLDRVLTVQGEKNIWSGGGEGRVWKEWPGPTTELPEPSEGTAVLYRELATGLLRAGCVKN